MRRPGSLGLAVVFASAWPAMVSAADVVEFYHVDAIGNVRVVTDASGAIVERHDYLPFGEECTTGPCASNPGIAASQPRHFTGKERDTETGLDYFGARYYRGNLARFTTVDPAMNASLGLYDPQRWNRYAHGRNNPFRYVDPDGRQLVLQQSVSHHLTPATYKRNAEIRATVGRLLKYDPFPQDAAAAGVVMGLLLPTGAKEQDTNAAMSVFGAVGMLEVGAEEGLVITMDEAVSQGAEHVAGEGVMETTPKGNFQFRSTEVNAAGQTESRMSRFDVNPADPHVQEAGPHLNREVHVNGKQTENVHTPIDPKTIRPGDHP